MPRAVEIRYAGAMSSSDEKRKLGWPFAVALALAMSASAAGAPVKAAPVASPLAIKLAADRIALTQPAQYIYLGRPYCWYPYGWAGAGWYWCGYGTRAGLGWGGLYGWNGWAVPRRYGTARAPGYRFRR